MLSVCLSDLRLQEILQLAQSIPLPETGDEEIPPQDVNLFTVSVHKAMNCLISLGEGHDHMVMNWLCSLGQGYILYVLHVKVSVYDVKVVIFS